MTPKQLEIYEFIYDFREKNSIPPTIREIADGTYTSDAYVSTCLGALEDNGYIRREKGKRRNIVIVRRMDDNGIM